MGSFGGPLFMDDPPFVVSQISFAHDMLYKTYDLGKNMVVACFRVLTTKLSNYPRGVKQG